MPGPCDNKAYPWKNGQCFEIARVEGVERVYDRGSEVRLSLVGRAVNADVAPEPQNGFCVAGYIEDFVEGQSVGHATDVWDEKLGGWHLTLLVPDTPRLGYLLSVALYCCYDESPCAATYGRAAQIRADYTIDVP